MAITSVIDVIKQLIAYVNKLIEEDKGPVTLDSYVRKQHNYNADSKEAHGTETVVNGNPDGLINTTKPAQGWQEPLWKRMMANTWFETEPDMSKESVAYKNLSADQQRMYELTIGSLIANDSFQTRNLAANISGYVSDPNLLMLIVRQDFEEALHSRSYGVLSTDVFKGSDPQRVFNIHKTDPELAKRNRWLQSLYDPLDLVDGEPVTFRMFLQAIFANLILEGIMFQGGFISIWSLGATMHGSSKMLAFIARDERTHLAVFFGIYNSLMKQFPTLDTEETKRMFLDMLQEAVEVEIAWLQYTTGDGVFIFSEDNIRDFIQGKANEVSAGIGYGRLYDSKDSVLKKLEDTYGKINNTRSNFFESKPAGYSKGTVDLSDI